MIIPVSQMRKLSQVIQYINGQTGDRTKVIPTPKLYPLLIVVRKEGPRRGPHPLTCWGLCVQADGTKESSSLNLEEVSLMVALHDGVKCLAQRGGDLCPWLVLGGSRLPRSAHPSSAHQGHCLRPPPPSSESEGTTRFSGLWLLVL